MEVLGDSGGGWVTHREKLRKFLGQQVMDQKVKEKQQHRKKSHTGLGLLGDGQESCGSPGWEWRRLLGGSCNTERKGDLCPAAEMLCRAGHLSA